MNFLEKKIENFIGKFSKDIKIQLGTDLVSFYRKAKSVQAKPILYISDNPKKPKVLAWGEGLTPNEPHLKVDVFDFSGTLSKTDIKPFDCLTAFFRHGISKVVDFFVLIKPIIIVYNVSTLDGLLHDEKENIIEKALFESGARECIFK